MWILAIPIGIISLFGAYRAARFLAKLLRRGPLSKSSTQVAYGLVILSTAFMVVPWLVPPVGFLRAIVGAIFLAYLGLGFDQLWRLYTGTRRAGEKAVTTVAAVVVSADPNQVVDGFLAAAALIGSEQPELLQQIGKELTNLPEFATFEPSGLTNQVVDKALEVDDFNRIELLKTIASLKDYPEVTRAIGAFVQRLDLDSETETVAEIQKALGSTR